MLIQGFFRKINHQWIAEIPLLATVVSGKPGESPSQVIERLKYLASQSHIEGEFIVREDDFFFRPLNLETLLPLALKRLRQKNKLSIGDVAKRLGHLSRNAYAQYEYGKTKLGAEKFRTLISALGIQGEIILSPFTNDVFHHHPN